ncbi:hypothetical protein Tco_0517095 [Tanacetum coccineum]
MSIKDSITTQTCELSQEEFNDFLALYPVPSEYHVILPKSNQTIFMLLLDMSGCTPIHYLLQILGFLLLSSSVKFLNIFRFIYQDSILLAVPSSLLLLSCVKLIVVSPLSTSFKDSIILAKYLQLLSEQNKLDLKSFKDKLPFNIKENPMFQRLSRYPTSVRVFPDPIIFLAGLKRSWEHDVAFRNFIYTEDDEDLAFFPMEPSPGFGTSSPSVSINTEPLKANEEPEIHPAECKTRGGSSRHPVKRKLASGSSTYRATCANTSSSKDDAPFLTVSNDDKGLSDVFKLKDATVCHLKISAITPPAWKNHLDNLMDLELLDLHDRCYARHAVVDNSVNKRSCELLQVIEKLRGECDVMRSRERAREEECKGMRVKCEAAMTEFEKNPIMVALREKIFVLSVEVKEHKLNLDRMTLEAVEVSLRKEDEELKQDRREVVSKVVPYDAMELIHSDAMGSLIAKLVSSAIVYGRCRAFKQVADMKEPFDLSKVKGYRSSYKKD